MIKKFYFGIPKKIRLFIIFLLIISAVYFIGRFIFVKTHEVPREFLKARQEASVIAQVIVTFSKGSAKRIENISALSNQGKYTEALNLVTAEMDKNREIRQRAISLSANLEIMAQNAQGIYPDSSANIAIQAISIETSLVSGLIDYNDYLNQLLEYLRMRLLGKSDPNVKINDLIDKINGEANIINGLNESFNDLMAKFDQHS